MAGEGGTFVRTGLAGGGGALATSQTRGEAGPTRCRPASASTPRLAFAWPSRAWSAPSTFNEVPPPSCPGRRIRQRPTVRPSCSTSTGARSGLALRHLRPSRPHSCTRATRRRRDESRRRCPGRSSRCASPQATRSRPATGPAGAGGHEDGERRAGADGRGRTGAVRRRRPAGPARRELLRGELRGPAPYTRPRGHCPHASGSTRWDLATASRTSDLALPGDQARVHPPPRGRRPFGDRGDQLRLAQGGPAAGRRGCPAPAPAGRPIGSATPSSSRTSAACSVPSRPAPGRSPSSRPPATPSRSGTSA